ncbi:MAG: histidine-type phosphatase [Prevotella sp.]|jgi:hypothetical protein
MKKILIVSAAIVFALSACAQQSQLEIRTNIDLAGSNYVAYPGPHKTLTDAPKGYEPYYISHYGRHGSRYLIGTDDYDKPYFTLLRADSLGKLTPTGRALLGKVKLIREEAMGRDGELTWLGAQQHHQIARRMYERFPEVFAGKTKIEARSTVVIRCILSMENALHELISLNPELDVRHDASHHDMYYMNDEHSRYTKLCDTPEAREVLKQFSDKHTDYTHLMRAIFNEADYVKTLDVNELGTRLFSLASNVQSTELRHQLSLWDIFSEEEIYNSWLCHNAWWYMYFGPSKQAGGAGMYTQVNLLKNIIATADTCLQLPHPGATLRYAHEVDVMPLVCLMNLNGYGETIDNLEDLDDRGWYNYNIFPMGCNVQLVFYKPTETALRDADILVKVLLNEDEATLPVATDRAPYYHWKDVRAYLMNRIRGK